MKTRILSVLIQLLNLLGSVGVVVGQSTAFTYQGRLKTGDVPANGLYDFRFALYDAQRHGQLIGGPVTNVAVSVSNGLFTTLVDFGEGVFSAEPAWLEIAVRPSEPGPMPPPFTTLKELQPLTPVPFAITARNVSGVISNSSFPVNPAFSGLVTAGGFAGNGSGLTSLNAAELTGVVPNSSLPHSPVFAGTVTAGGFAGNGNGLTNLNADQLTGTVPAAALANAWKLSGNVGTTPGTHFIGTIDNQPLEFKVYGQCALRLQPNPTSPNVIEGYAGNYIAPGACGSTIGGGGSGGCTNAIFGNFATIGGGSANTIQTATGATIGGGEENTIRNSGVYATIGGGWRNTIEGVAFYTAIGGGIYNTIQPCAYSATIGGGDHNTIRTNSENATIAGGTLNTIGTNANSATIGGGIQNIIGDSAGSATIGGGAYNSASGMYATVSGGSGNVATGTYATIPGGHANRAYGNHAFAAGHRAKASHTGSFVWGDSTDAEIVSAADNSVTFRASGGYRLFSDAGATTGVSLAPGSGSWTSLSDRNAKENFEPVDAQDVLQKVIALPICRWNYKSQNAGIRHIGPNAQDFHAAFGVGEADRGITAIDADGVALAAIQGLNQKLESEKQEAETRLAKLEEELNRRDAENAELKARLARLEELVQQLIK